MRKVVYFDMDGTLCDFYGVSGWLDYLIKHDSTPYRIAKPVLSFPDFQRLIQSYAGKGYEIGIISWCSKDNDADFKKEVRKAKKEWLAKYFPFATEIHIVAYGTPKWSLVKKEERAGAILFDDEEQNLTAWRAHGGIAIHASEIRKVG